ncbi:MAG: hypothetical protein H6742_04395 [Alphaproteobacteria bacterium]|nr:hypothetical protein [Alphaproteobacteria bacterium]
MVEEPATPDATARTQERQPEQQPVGVYLFGKIGLAFALLVFSGVIAFRSPDGTYAPNGAFYLIGLAFVVWAASAWGLRQTRDLVRYGWFQLVFDAVLVTALVAVTSGIESPLAVLYFINIIAAPFLVPTRGVAMVFMLDVIGFSAVAWAGRSGLLPWLAGTHRTIDLQEFLLHLFAMALVGMLSVQLTRSMTSILERSVARGQALAAERALILSELDVGLAELDAAGRITLLNPVLERLLGDVRGEDLQAVLPGEGDTYEVSMTAEDGEPLRALCTRRRRTDGVELVLVQDVTWLREMEEAVAREERLAGVGKLAAGLAHEIRNPLASLSGSIQLLQEESPGPLHGIALREVRRLNDLVNEFLEAARPPRIEPQPTDLGQLVEEVVETFSHDPRYCDRIAVEVEQGRDLPLVPVDPRRFRQVLWNLLLNAAQATVGDGTISLTLRRRADHVSLRMSDTGVGIQPDQLRSIFDPFFTTRAGGTGLGLANVERIVRGHGGSVSVYSKPGQGTTFMIALPVAVEDHEVAAMGRFDMGENEVIEVDG